jgi:ribosomal protein S12 methylthiotransferase accessory factor
MSRGVSRIVDTTWLDKIGIPVYASIRPDGVEGALCVHAGKGFTHDEAKIGAYMEAIEFSFAEPGRNVTGWSISTPLEVVKTFGGQIRFSDFCPRRGVKIQADSPLAVVEANEILSERGAVLVPAELIYHPFLDNPGVRLYGTTTNGLASGNTVHEAIVHGLAEVMERHVRSLEVMVDRSMLVDTSNAPRKVQLLVKQIESAGLSVALRYSENEFGLPYFASYVMEPDEHHPIAIAAGYGFHPISEIAAVRAIAEAVQGRLSHIHGGRDDIIKRVNLAEKLGRNTELDYIRRSRDSATSNARTIRFADVPSHDAETVEEAQSCLFDSLRRTGMNHVAYVQLTPDDYPLQVVKVVVPGAEMFEYELDRVGERLMKHTLGAKSE